MISCFTDPPVQKNLISKKKEEKKKEKKKEAHVIKCGELALPQFPFIMLHIIVMESMVEFNDIHDFFFFLADLPTHIFGNNDL